jgi:hypothetical protein
MKPLRCVHSSPIIVCDLCISSAQCQLFGVFDGHGGKKAADFAREHLPRVLSEELTIDATDPGACLIRAFEKTDQQFIDGSDVRNTTRSFCPTFNTQNRHFRASAYHFVRVPKTDAQPQRASFVVMKFGLPMLETAGLFS